MPTAAIADARFAFPLDEVGTDVALAPLLRAGPISWRSLVIAGEGKTLGLCGFGAGCGSEQTRNDMPEQSTVDCLRHDGDSCVAQH
jgi:D-arabinose 1-dehydrogenase-like Zn-dependent alcohol dehydrogenase